MVYLNIGTSFVGIDAFESKDIITLKTQICLPSTQELWPFILSKFLPVIEIKHGAMVDF